MKIIEITVSPKGKTNIETKGFTGSACQNASQFLTKALGRKTSEQLKPEFHTPACSDHQIDQGM